MSAAGSSGRSKISAAAPLRMATVMIDPRVSAQRVVARGKMAGEQDVGGEGERTGQDQEVAGRHLQAGLQREKRQPNDRQADPEPCVARRWLAQDQRGEERHDHHRQPRDEPRLGRRGQMQPGGLERIPGEERDAEEHGARRGGAEGRRRGGRRLPCPPAHCVRAFLCRSTTNGNNASAAKANRSARKLNTGKLATAFFTITNVLPQIRVTRSSAASAVSWRLRDASKSRSRDDAASSPFAASSRSLAVVPSAVRGGVAVISSINAPVFSPSLGWIPQPAPLRPQAGCERARGVARLRAACCSA